MIEVHQLPALSDNFAYVVREKESGLTATIDTPDAKVIADFLDKKGWKLDFIFNTHHHRDHVGGNAELISRYGCKVYGSAKDEKRIPGIEKKLKDGDEFFFGKEKVKVFSADGHTIGHIVYWMPDSNILFVGDTIFSLGCGKLFEGSAQQMWTTLAKLRELPDSTLIYCAHEYTLENAGYAILAEPGNKDLKQRIEECKALRAAGKFTVPSSMASERACNPFLRPESKEIQRNVHAEGQELWQVFGATRESKDEFDSRN
ncbi:MAG TPA: hydroxyacylglutathione hydrolase [Bdellovibrionota bacterium]|jgi:hydroxyacylglutathione hydrolase